MKRFLVLAGGSDQADLMDILRDKFPGCYIILADMAPKVLASSLADKHLVISTMDFDAVRKAAKEEKVDCIITACGDQPLITMATISEELGLPCYLTKDEALSMTNKLHMKKKMLENGIPTSKYINISDLSEGIKDLNFPVMVKPADCNGSLGVRKANNFEELSKFFEQAAQYSFSKTAIIEEFKEGIEVSIDGYVCKGEVKIIMISELRKKKIGENVLLIFQSIIPAQISEEAKDNIQLIANTIAKVFNLKNTPLLIQAIVDNNSVNVIEFAPRIGGGSKHRTVSLITGFEYLKANINAMFGGIPKIEIHPDKYIFSRNHIFAYPCTFSHVENADKLIADGTIEEYIPYKMKGATVGEFLASRDRVGSFLVKGETLDEVNRKIAKTVSTLKVIDSEGRDVMKREIWDE